MSGAKPDGTTGGKLAPCPASPNCVCSDTSSGSHAIQPLAITGDPQAAWQALIAYLEAQAGFTIKTREPDYLHVEARTRVFRFVNDVEFQLRSSDGLIAMRSASRIGYSDLGANRRRLDAIRQVLADAGVAKPGG